MTKDETHHYRTPRAPANRMAGYGAVIAALFLLTGCGAVPASHTPAGPPPGPAVSHTVYTPPAPETETSPSPKVQPTQRKVPPGPAAPLVWQVPVKERVVFITIDDGWSPSSGVLTLMRQYNLPVTAFLIQEAAHENVAYWKEFLQAGGTIEDHTYSHPWLTHITPAQDLAQIKSPVTYFKYFGASVDELRPPYGDVDLTVQKEAAAAGINYVVMWDAVMSGGRLRTWHGQALRPGDIVLMHWVPGLDGNLSALIRILQRDNLGVASLTDALDGRPLKVAWLNEKGPHPATSTTVYNNISAAKKPIRKP